MLTGLDPIIVTRKVPAIHIFLTLDDVDQKTLGYQKANVPTSFWPEPASKQQKKDVDYAYKNKKNFNGNNRNSNQQRNSRPSINQQPGQSNNRNRDNKPKKDVAGSSKPQGPAAS